MTYVVLEGAYLCSMRLCADCDGEQKKKKERKNKTERNYLLFPGIQCPWVRESHFSLPWEAQTALSWWLSRILEGAFCLPRSLSIDFKIVFIDPLGKFQRTEDACGSPYSIMFYRSIDYIHGMSRFPHTYLPGISFLYNTIKNPK